MSISDIALGGDGAILLSGDKMGVLFFFPDPEPLLGEWPKILLWTLLVTGPWRPMGLAGKVEFLSLWFPEYRAQQDPLPIQSLRTLWDYSDP